MSIEFVIPTVTDEQLAEVHRELELLLEIQEDAMLDELERELCNVGGERGVA